MTVRVKVLERNSHEPISLALAELLSRRSITAAQLSRTAKVTPGAVSRYLSGERGTRLERRGAEAIERIAAALELEPDYFREYRAWRLREIIVVAPDLMDDVYDRVVELARLRGLIKERP